MDGHGDDVVECATSHRNPLRDVGVLCGPRRARNRPKPDSSVVVAQEILSHKAACSPLESALGPGKVTFGDFALFYTSSSGSENQKEVKQVVADLKAER